MNNQIYIVISDEYSIKNVRAVFSTKEGAEKYIEEYEKNRFKMNRVVIKEYTIDEHLGGILRPTYSCELVLEDGTIFEHEQIRFQVVNENYTENREVCSGERIIFTSSVSLSHAVQLAKDYYVSFIKALTV